MIIKNIFDGKFDAEVHSDFLKFGKGEFKDKYLVEAKKVKDRWNIKTGAEFANYLVRKGIEKNPGKIKVTGAIVSTMDLNIPFSIGKKQFMGVKQFQISGDVEAKQILDLMNQYPRVFFALSFILPDYELKIKAKAPKSAKPSTSEKEAKAEFCSLKTSDSNFVKEMFFDFPSFQEISVRHTLKISDMIYPKDLSKMKPEEVREQSKRKGVLIRNVLIDGKNEVREAKFEA
jgi:hypothetical protein